MEQKIDFVFPFVDDRDKVWQEAYNKYFFKSYGANKNDVIKFRSWNLLRYLFRGIEFYAPFINNVFMIVSNIEQVPDWLNKKEVKIVLHKDIISEEYLPTFSSPCIEMHLGNIKDLSEHFIYGNDDTFFTALTTPELFFSDNGKIKANLYYEPINDICSMFTQSIINEYNILARHFNVPEATDQFLRPYHCMAPMLKSTVALAQDLFRYDIKASLKRIRTNKDINQYFYTELNYFIDKVEPSNIKFKQFASDLAMNNIVSTITNRTAHTICINDGLWENLERNKKVIESAFVSALPKQSKYELYSSRPTRPDWLKKEV